MKHRNKHFGLCVLLPRQAFLTGLTAGSALVCCNAAQAQQECVESFNVAGSDGVTSCFTDGTGYYSVTWTGGCLATNINYSGGDIDIAAQGLTENFLFFGFEPGTCETMTITFEDGSTAGGVEVCNECVPAVCGDGICEATESYPTCPEDCEIGSCSQGQVADCDGSGECWSEQWIGDGYCDGAAQNFGADLCCYDLNRAGNDGGDCTKEQCAPILGACCFDGVCVQLIPDQCEADGGVFAGGDCDTFPCGSKYEDCGDPASGSCFEDNGTAGCIYELCCATVCEYNAACCLISWDAACVELANQYCNPGQGSCAADFVEDCTGSGECRPVTWVGDGYCDGNVSNFGINLCCFDNDGGDCTEEQCEVQVCGDGICVEGETPATCPDDCDAADCTTITVTNPDDDFEGCTADGTSGLITLTWEGGCVASTIEFVGLGTLIGTLNSGVIISGGLGTASECYDIIVTFDDGSIADPVNGCHNCGDPPVCGDGDCVFGETFESCPEDCDDSGCATGQIADCDLSGECWTDAWIGDGFCDGTAQEWGANLCCYDGGTPGAFDGGDCTAEDCGESGDPTGACCVDTTCSISTEADCFGEWQGADTACHTNTCRSDCLGDFNDDGSIGGADLTILLNQWGCTGQDCTADLDGNGTVDGADLTIILNNWGACSN